MTASLPFYLNDHNPSNSAELDANFSSLEARDANFKELWVHGEKLKWVFT